MTSLVWAGTVFGPRLWPLSARRHLLAGCIPCPNVSTTPITAMGCRQCLPSSVVQLKGKHCRKTHCHNGVVDTFGPCVLLVPFNFRYFYTFYFTLIWYPIKDNFKAFFRLQAQLFGFQLKKGRNRKSDPHFKISRWDFWHVMAFQPQSWHNICVTWLEQQQQ